MDAHGLLGLPPDAGEHEVKRAFRRLAMRWHPDRNPDPAALEHFKRLRAAYESILAALAAANDNRAGSGNSGSSDDDSVGNGAPDATGDPATDATGESAGDSADESTEAGSGERGPDRRQDLMLTIEEAFFGGERTVEVEDAVACERCDASGVEQLTHTRLCAACHGSGRLRSHTGLTACGDCVGRGYLSKQPCPACDGTGRRRERRCVSVTVPAGVIDGEELRIAGAGGATGPEGVAPGDLILTVVLAPHPLYRLEGRNLVLSRPVSAFRMLLGGELAVPLPGGIRHVRLPAGSAAPRELRVRGGGFPDPEGGASGALIVRLVPVVPNRIAPRARALLEEVENELAADGDAAMPDLANWEARWLSSRDN